ncbi:Thiol:disulfide oxidoreductase related to ResA [hydrothermal vent metagenome]|uniref:Thiol:disulfide oxidoreductase related to ResA n=1 Tax=hydrothermal vent metagenome TaxID=652676 RepID=A0A3B0WVJ9_9ZZZZ
MKFRKNLLITLLLLPVVVIADWQKPKLSHNLTAVEKVIVATDFELLNIDEEKKKLSDYKGKVILLNFWATWCPPCVREMPSMERLHQQINADNFKVIAVNQMEDIDQVFAFTGQLEVDPTFEILFDSSSSVSQQYAVRGLPTTYLIDKKGKIRYRAVGGRKFNHPEVIKIINSLIDE